MMRAKRLISKSLNIVLILSVIILIFGIIVWDSKYAYWERHTDRWFISNFLWAFGIGIVIYFVIWGLIKIIRIIISKKFPNLKIYSAPSIIFNVIFLLYFIIFNIIVLVYISGELPILIRNKKLAFAKDEKKEELVRDYINEWYEYNTTHSLRWTYTNTKRFSTLSNNDPVFVIICKLANNNDAIAQYYLGSHYYKLPGLKEKDEQVNSRSYYWYYKAANNENEHAQLKMAQFFWIQGEIDKSIEYYNKAIKNGNTAANLKLGRIYFNNGYLDVAKQIWEDGAKKGNTDCQSELERLEFLN